MRNKLVVTGVALLLAACSGGQEDRVLPAPVRTAATVFQSAAALSAARTQAFEEVRAAYQVTLGPKGATVVHLASGRSVAVEAGVQRLRFADGTLVIDTEGNGGTVYRVYQAAFDRKPDAGGYAFWLDAADKGMDIGSIAAEFLKSPEFRTLYGTAPGNADLLSRYYQNVLHRQPDPAGYDYWLKLLNAGAVTPAQMLAMFSDGEENKAQVAADVRGGIWLPGPVQSLDGMFRVTTRTTAVEVPPTHCLGTNCSASLYCEAPSQLGETITADLRIILDAAQKKATLYLEKEVVVGTYEPSASGLAAVRFDVVYEDEEVMVTPLTRYYSSGGIRLDLRYDSATREFSGTMFDRTANRWTLDNHVATCTATSTLRAVPIPQ